MRAAAMPRADRRKRMRAMRRRVNENDVANWSAKFLRVLEATKGRDAADAAPAQVAAP